jgi:hypothetical protein
MSIGADISEQTQTSSGGKFTYYPMKTLSLQNMLVEAGKIIDHEKTWKGFFFGYDEDLSDLITHRNLVLEIVPVCSNYLLEIKRDDVRLVDVYGKHSLSNSKIGVHIATKGLSDTCQIGVNKRDYDLIYKTVKLAHRVNGRCSR